MKKKPILFNGPMVRALLAGAKTQTRRPIDHAGNADHYGKLLGSWALSKPPKQYEGEELWRWQGKHPPKNGDWIWELQTDVDDNAVSPLSCPYGPVGRKLWVRETWWEIPIPTAKELRDGADTWPEVAYPATNDNPDYTEWGWKKKPSIHMPRWASRITLEVTGVRVERVHEITENDAQAEGVQHIATCGNVKFYRDKNNHYGSAKDAFEAHWDSTYGKKYPWDSNPWVWVIEFKRVKP